MYLTGEKNKGEKEYKTKRKYIFKRKYINIMNNIIKALQQSELERSAARTTLARLFVGQG